MGMSLQNYLAAYSAGQGINAEIEGKRAAAQYNQALAKQMQQNTAMKQAEEQRQEAVSFEIAKTLKESDDQWKQNQVKEGALPDTDGLRRFEQETNNLLTVANKFNAANLPEKAALFEKQYADNSAKLYEMRKKNEETSRLKRQEIGAGAAFFATQPEIDQKMAFEWVKDNLGNTQALKFAVAKPEQQKQMMEQLAAMGSKDPESYLKIKETQAQNAEKNKAAAERNKNQAEANRQKAQYLAGKMARDGMIPSNKEERSALVDSIVQYKNPPPTETQISKGGNGLELMNDILEKDPTYDRSKWIQIKNSRNQWHNGKKGAEVLPLNVVKSHLATAYDLVDTLDNTDIRKFNMIKNYAEQEFGGTAKPVFDSVRQFVANEIVKAVIGTAGGVFDRKEMMESFSSADSGPTLKAKIKEFAKLIDGRLEGKQKEYERDLPNDNDFQERFLYETRHASHMPEELKKELYLDVKKGNKKEAKTSDSTPADFPKIDVKDQTIKKERLQIVEQELNDALQDYDLETDPKKKKAKWAIVQTAQREAENLASGTPSKPSVKPVSKSGKQTYTTSNW